MRFQNKKVSARATALALVLGVVGVLVTALPAWAAAPTITSFTPTAERRERRSPITGTGFRSPSVQRYVFNGVTATFTSTEPHR